MNTAVRPIHISSDAAVDVLRQRGQAALDGWAREWVSGWTSDGQRASKVQVRAVTDGAGVQSYEFEALRTEAGCIWFSCSPVDRLSFGRAVVGAELMRGSRCADDWIAGLIDCARDARNRALCSGLLGMRPIEALPAGACVVPPELFVFGSGAIQLSCDALGLYAIADSAVWRSVPPVRTRSQPLPKLAPLDQAASRARMRLDVMLGSVEVELPKLLDLRCGDVLRLPQRLDQEVAVLCEGKPLAHAALGETQGCKAIQVIARHP